MACPFLVRFRLMLRASAEGLQDRKMNPFVGMNENAAERSPDLFAPEGIYKVCLVVVETLEIVIILLARLSLLLILLRLFLLGVKLSLLMRFLVLFGSIGNQVAVVVDS